MQPQTMTSFAAIFPIIYLICVVGIMIYVLKLLGRFVSAHERTADAVEVIARKLRDDVKP